MELSGTKPYVPSDEAFDMNRRLNTDKPSTDALAFHKFEHQGWEVSVQAYAQYFGQLTSATITYLLDAAAAGTGTRLLDLATGPGYVAASAQKRGCNVVAVDFSESMIALAKSTQSNSINFEVADVQNLPQADVSVDSAVMNFGILHLSEPERALAEVFRILKPGGKMAFTVWAQPEEAKGFSLILRAIETFGSAEVPIPAGPPFFGFSDPAHAERVLADLGFIHIASQKVPLVWVLDSPQDVFTAFYEGTARTGGLLRRQAPDALLAIKHAVANNCAPYVTKGKARIPMPALVYSASKPT
jgi:SAM-dependent methyltransferase